MMLAGVMTGRGKPACARRGLLPVLLLCLCTMAWVRAQGAADLGFTTRVSPALVTQLVERFSARSRTSMRSAKGLAAVTPGTNFAR